MVPCPIEMGRAGGCRGAVHQAGADNSWTGVALLECCERAPSSSLPPPNPKETRKNYLKKKKEKTSKWLTEAKLMIISLGKTHMVCGEGLLECWWCSIFWMLHECSLYNHLLYLKFMVFKPYLAYVLNFITYKKRLVK